MAKFTKEDALNYHANGRPGKIEVIPTKPHATQRDLSLAYSPGVAQPCLEIHDNPDDVYKYTAKGNLVAVISNGTAVLGLGDIGAEAGKPVMEGKGLLFKIFADIDVFDIEVTTKDIDIFVETVKQISPTFGGINLEDIKAPECFEIEERLKRELNIPVMHDDQHGTAMISAAGLLNALEIVGKDISKVRLVVNGAGASAIACTKLYVALGVSKENVVMLDTKGVLHNSRKDLNKYKMLFSTDLPLHTLEEAMKGADVFIGLSSADILSKEMVQSMADNPIIFAMANPDPEISYELAMSARKDLIFATGRSDYPNQVNNVLGFPFIFRGALDVRATSINEEMKLAAVKALAQLAKLEVPESVSSAYNKTNLHFGREYIIPKPLDPRLIYTVAPAVAKAAMESGVARQPITDWEAYEVSLKQRMGLDNQLLRYIFDKAKASPKSVVFNDANHFNVLKAALTARQEGIAHPVLLGNVDEIKELIEKFELDFGDVTIIDPSSNVMQDKRKKYAQIFYTKRQRKGMTFAEALERMHSRHYFGAMMVESGDADALLTGYASKYSDAIIPSIEAIGVSNKVKHLAGAYLMMTKKGPFFFSDTTVNMEPTAQTLVESTLVTAATVRKFNLEPVIALVSYSNFGGTKGGNPQIVRDAIQILHRDHPDLIVDGEMQANFAFNTEMRMKKFPFTKLGNRQVNTIIFPNLSSGNIAYKMMQEIGQSEAIGPILMGLSKSVQIVQLESSVREIVNLAAFAVMDAQK